jgi:hypothetical protein
MDLQQSQPSVKTACWACGGVIDSQDSYCRHCSKGQGSHVPWQYKHWGVIAMFFVVGPFVIPSVWRSPVISKRAKWI